MLFQSTIACAILNSLSKQRIRSLISLLKNLVVSDFLLLTRTLFKSQEQIQQETQQAQQQQFAQQALADPRVAIEAGRYANENGKAVAVRDGEVSLENKE